MTTQSTATLIGHVASVTGGVVTVRLASSLRTTLIMLEGESYRVGQVGAFVRIPLGYTQLYAVAVQVGAAAAPPNTPQEEHSNHRWLSVTLFGESLGENFQRGVSQYPTVGDEVHLVTRADLKVVYGPVDRSGCVTVGKVAASGGIPGQLDLARLVSRHAAIVGSTGSGKSNLVSVLLDAIAEQGFPSARVLVIDPHGEYGSAARKYGYLFGGQASDGVTPKSLEVPFWALPFDELRAIAFGDLPLVREVAIRDEIEGMRKKAATALARPPRESAITSDSPIPFSLNQLWFDLDDFERKTFKLNGGNDPYTPTKPGSAVDLIPNEYPPKSPGNSAPYGNPHVRGIARQLEHLRIRLKDSQYKFLFDTASDFFPDLAGACKKDLDSLIQQWIGHDRPISVMDLSIVPSEILPVIVGAILRMLWDALFWGMRLSVGGRNRPLLIVLEEAHRFIPEGKESAAHRIISTIAKEGRKYGVGILVVTQRPTEVSTTILSQCGTVIALRTTNEGDRGKVKGAMPDDLGALAGLLPSLRTGEGLVMGEATAVPSRIKFKRSIAKLEGSDPKMPEAWRAARDMAGESYAEAILNWRQRSL